MKTKSFFAASAALFLFALSGCNLFVENYQEPQIYDLGIPQVAKKLPFSIEIVMFGSESSARYKMQIRFADNRILYSEYNRWTRTPPAMLTNYIRLAMANQATDTTPRYSLYGSILLFEADAKENVARMSVKYVISDWNKEIPLVSRLVTITEKFPAMKNPRIEFAALYSEAMTKAAAKLSEDIYNDLISLYTEKK